MAKAVGSDSLSAKVKINDQWTDAKLVPATVSDLKKVKFTGPPQAVPAIVEGQKGVGVYIPCQPTQISELKGTTVFSNGNLPSAQLVRGIDSKLPDHELLPALRSVKERLDEEGIFFGGIALAALEQRLADLRSNRTPSVAKAVKGVQASLDRVNAAISRRN